MAREITITDGTDTAEFVDGVSSNTFRLVEYLAALPKAKRGGVYQSSPLGRGRVLVMRQYENVNDALTFQVNDKDKAQDQDDAIDELGTLLQLLMERAVTYWELPRQAPVYMTRKARNETGRQYALIVYAEVDGLPDLFGIEFDQIVIEDITIKLERFPWQSVIPGSAGAATEVVLNPWQTVTDYEARLLGMTPAPVALWVLDDTSGTTAVSSIEAGQNGTYYDEILNSLLFVTGVPAAFLGIGNGAVDIDTAAFRSVFNEDEGTAMLWVRSSGGIIWTSGNEHPILYLYIDANNYLYLYKSTTDGQIILNVRTPFGHNPTYLDGIDTTEWLCLTAVWSNTNNSVQLYMNGVLVSSAPLINFMSGTLSVAVIGSNTVGSGPGWSGEMSHVTIWDEALDYTQVAEAYNATATDEETTAQGEVMVANARTLNNLTHVYTYDASLTTFSSNLANSVAHNLLPASLANGDILYMARFDGANAIPFNNAVFDVNTPGAGYTLTWQYYNGSWTTLTTQDNTDQLQNEGINSVHWAQPSDWATVAINGLTTYWVRGLVSGVSSPTTPTQQNRPVYTARLPYFELLDTAVSGDMSALARLLFRVQADKLAGGGLPYLWANRLIMGLRKYDGSEGFQAFINLSGRQNDPGITVSVATMASFVTDVTTPSGRRITFNPTGATSLTLRASVILGAAISTYYTGRFHVFVRCKQVNGSAGGIGVQLRVAQGTVATAYQQVGDVAYLTAVDSNFQLLDLGEFVINANYSANDTNYVTRLAIFLSSVDGTPDLYLYDLILIPVDEWYGDFIDPGANPGTALARYAGVLRDLDIDAVSNPRAWVRADIRGTGDLIQATWNKQALNGEPILLNGQRHRVWCLWGRALSGVWTYDPEIVNSIQVLRADRWLGHRGSR